MELSVYHKLHIFPARSECEIVSTGLSIVDTSIKSLIRTKRMEGIEFSRVLESKATLPFSFITHIQNMCGDIEPELDIVLPQEYQSEKISIKWTENPKKYDDISLEDFLQNILVPSHMRVLNTLKSYFEEKER